MGQRTENGILLDKVTFGYPGAKPIIDNFTLEVQPGSFTVIVGASGCGKTTLLNLIAGFTSPVAGSVIVGGKTITGPGPDRGVVFQGDSSLLGWRTVEDNVAFGLEIEGVGKAERLKRAHRALETVNLSADHKKYPRELSGGMKQRVAIARGFCQDPRVLLMDEPFAALDEQTRLSLGDELLSIWEQHRKTVVFVTHSLTEAVYLCDEVVVMAARPGRVIRRIEIDLPRPRTYKMMATARFGELRDEIWDLIRNVEHV